MPWPIPDLSASASPLPGGLSVSLARDVFLGRAAPVEPDEAAAAAAAGDGGGEGEGEGAGVLVDNFDGLYAAADIAQGAVVLTEAEMPECELPRVAHDPSCAVAAPQHSQTSTRPSPGRGRPRLVHLLGGRLAWGRLAALVGAAPPLREMGAQPMPRVVEPSSARARRPDARRPIPSAPEP